MNWPPNGRLAGSSIGAGRWVYPGFLQLAAFMSMNLERHLRSFGDMAEARAINDMTKLEVLQSFYEEYFAVMDLPAEFYLETVKMVFQDNLLPLARIMHRRLTDVAQVTDLA